MKRKYTINLEMLGKRTEKCCNTCGITKPLSEFHKRYDTSDRHRNDCKACRIKYKDITVIKILPNYIICMCYGKSYPRDNKFFSGNLELPHVNRKCKECKRKYRLNHALLKSYSIDEDDKNNMIKKQDGKCYICGSDYKLVVDHDHKTNKVRKILCDTCNRGIGFLRENINILQSAINYLKEHEN